MSKSSNTTQQEDGDETMLFDDGFSIVDDINAGTGALEVEEPKKEVRKEEKANGKERNKGSRAPEETNSRKIVSDKDMKKEEVKKSNTKKEIGTEKEKSSNVKESGKKETSCEMKSTIKSASSGEGTLIISNDEDLGNDVPTSEDSTIKIEKTATDDELKITKNKDETSISGNTSTSRKKGTESSFVWISNITKFVKASGLKKHFSECGKVNTAKVVTNGKVFFGYVEFETVEHAAACVKQMNNSILGGKKILVSRTRPDVTKKTAPPIKKAPKVDPVKPEEVTKNKSDDKKEDDKGAKEDVKKADDKKEEKAESEEKGKREEKKKVVSKEKDEKKDKKARSVKDDPQPTKSDDDLKKKLGDTKKRLEKVKEDLDRSQIEVRNLRRRLNNELKRSKTEEMRAEKYRLEVRTLSDQAKQTRLDFDKELHHVNKKHKLELEKAEYQRENFLKQKDELKRRQDDLDREYKKLEEAKKLFEHVKRSRKSRSVSPPPKRFRGRDGMFPDHRSPPPPPKLSSEVRPKPLLERPTYYEEKKPRPIYDRLGDYGDKSFGKEANGRHRSGYPGDVAGISKAPWGQSSAESWKKPSSSAESWKKPNSSATFLKPYMERYASNTHPGYQVPSSSYYPQASSEYNKHGHFDSSRKY